MTHSIIDQARDRLAQMAAEEFDRVIERALDAHIGRGEWHVENLRGRLTRVSVRGQDFETYCCDGVPLVRVWPLELVWSPDGRTVSTTRRYSYLIDVGQ